MTDATDIETWTLTDLVSLLAELLRSHVTLSWERDGIRKTIQSDPQIGEWLLQSLTETTLDKEKI